MIRHASFKHGWFYHYRVHTGKQVLHKFPLLQSFLLDMFEQCPHEYFQEGPRSSGLRFPLSVDIIRADGHEICGWAKEGLQTNRYKTAHSNVQVHMLECDPKTIAVEVPLWSRHDELNLSLEQDQIPLTGHIDLVAIENDHIWVWDYKPNAHREKHAHVQTYVYACMLSIRTGIPLSKMRCGYFDEKACFLFDPNTAQ